MDCGKMPMLISKFVDRECSASDRLRVKEHLKICSSCKDFYSSINQLDSLATSAIYSEHFGEQRLSAILDKVQEHPIPTKKSTAPFRALTLGKKVALAASILLLSSTAYVLTQSPFQSNITTSTQRLEQAQDLQALRMDYLNSQHEISQALLRLEAIMADNKQDPYHDSDLADIRTQTQPNKNAFASIDNNALDNMVFVVYAHAESDANIISWIAEHDKNNIAGVDIYRSKIGAENTSVGSIRLNKKLLTDHLYSDTDIDPQTLYRYDITLHTKNSKKTYKKNVTVKSKNDIRISFNASFHGTQGPDSAHVSVSKYFAGQWITESFSLHPGDPIGSETFCNSLQRKFDFSTSFKLVAIDYNQKEQRSRKISVRMYDHDNGQPLLDKNGFYIYNSIDQNYEIENDRMIYEDPQGGKRLLWLHGTPNPDNE